MESISSEVSIWGRRSFVIVTGASRGIGRTIAIEFAKLITEDSTMLLLARSISGLEESKATILKARPNLNVELQSNDLSKPDEQQYTQILGSVANNVTFDLYLLVHNAGTIIVDTPAADMADLGRWQEYMTVNLYSATMLTSSFLKLFKERKRCVINISSLAGRVPFKGLGMYCAVKASRELFFKVLAIENPTVSVLNYSPGPIETDMYETTTTSCCFPDVVENFRNLKTEGRLVRVEDSVAKLVSILKEQSYENGATIDYFDR